ncbi:hypothetical protein [Bradyrhizobium symbiodeficiens]|uniref:hypothetical protein n=1 Tax=Bradyrhizobium symbiodeficiens TaxID=1404367 RepID=UPI00140FDD09|nr:hypothetical protein [Bradyrhizobium symbiodeficiens]QIO98556.1 hypothetical protein HAU86_01430 [Bradyrhizobium symbiodeficiens]
MGDEQDIFTDHYARIRRDPALRRRLIEDPVAGLKEHFGFMPDGDYRIEVIAQEPDTITIALPAPVDGDTSDEAIDAACRRVYDMLFTDGIGGYLVPDESLTWVLRDMRSSWAARNR